MKGTLMVELIGGEMIEGEFEAFDTLGAIRLFRMRYRGIWGVLPIVAKVIKTDFPE